MGRAILKSDPVIFRPTVEHRALLEKLAGAKGMTVNQYVADYVSRALEAKKGQVDEH